VTHHARAIFALTRFLSPRSFSELRRNRSGLTVSVVGDKRGRVYRDVLSRRANRRRVWIRYAALKCFRYSSDILLLRVCQGPFDRVGGHQVTSLDHFRALTPSEKGFLFLVRPRRNFISPPSGVSRGAAVFYPPLRFVLIRPGAFFSSRHADHFRLRRLRRDEHPSSFTERSQMVRRHFSPHSYTDRFFSLVPTNALPCPLHPHFTIINPPPVYLCPRLRRLSPVTRVEEMVRRKAFDVLGFILRTSFRFMTRSLVLEFPYACSVFVIVITRLGGSDLARLFKFL